MDWIDVNTVLLQLDAEWRPHREVPTGPLMQRIAEHRNFAADLALVFDVHAKGHHAQQLLADTGIRTSIDWSDTGAVTALAGDIDTAIDCIEVAALEGEIAALADSLRVSGSDDAPRPLLNALVAAVQGRNLAGFKTARRAIAEAHSLRADLTRLEELLGRFRSTSPGSATLFEASFEQPVWDQRLDAFEEAWSWALADRWLASSLSPGSLERLSALLERDEEEIRAVLGQLAAERAWSYCFSRMTEMERMNLVAWTKAMRKIGKGTGKYAARYRREAREYLQGCRSAIPAWVMPTFRVAETIRPGQDRFDVVIIDEASQSGIETLFLHYLGDKLVVVGDDKQISPEHVGTNLQDVEDLRRRHIPDLPLSPTFSVETSLFSQGDIRFGNRVRLREHFRCMPEIIQFCNQLQYAGEPLVPLRQFGCDRLEPIVVHHVGDGYQEGTASSAINRPEVDAVVNTIRACCRDARYADATMGVISLLGEAQARLVERRLLETLGAEEMEDRKLMCGDAYSFQGDERDVMFLTMVSAPNARIGPLTSEAARRRFNVAVSRAKDQLWLFHSVTPKDLSPTCVRKALLEYCEHPSWDRIVAADLSLDDLHRSSLRSVRRDMGPPAPFDSWFEVDVYLRIADAGFRVAPQYSVAGYRIDMVIEGASGRLAVECDGDEVHGGLEHYEADMVRQRRLERCGLKFWRVGGGEFYRDPEAALASLWDTLDRRGILSGGAAKPAKAPPSLPTLTEAPPQVVVEAAAQDQRSRNKDEERQQSASLADGVADDQGSQAFSDEPGSLGAVSVELSNTRSGARNGDDEQGDGSDAFEPLSWDEYQAGVRAWPFPELDEAAQAPLAVQGLEDRLAPRPAEPIRLDPAVAAAKQPERLAEAVKLPDRPADPAGPPARIAESAQPTSAASEDERGWLRHGVLGALPAGTAPVLAPYRVAEILVNTHGLHLAQMPRASLAQLITRVVDIESPVFVTEVASRLARASGLGRVHQQTEKAFRDSASYAASNHMIVRKGDLLWSKNDARPVIRDRSECPAELRLTESVPMVEIEWATHHVVNQAGSVLRQDIARAVSRVLGFHRTTDAFGARVERAIERALKCRAMTLSGNLVRVAPSFSRGSNSEPLVRPSGPLVQSPAPLQSGASDSQPQEDESSVEEEQARILICTLPDSTDRRSTLNQIRRLGIKAIGPLIEATADSRVAPYAVTALVDFGSLAKEQLVRALDSPNRQVRIHAGEALSRAGLDDDL